MTDWLAPARAALDAATGPVTLFFRDDDAGWEDDRLFALLDAFATHGLPIDLAIIPDELTPALARHLLQHGERGAVGLHQHGWAHRNHEPAGAKKWEFGPERARDAQHADIARGRDRLAELLGPDATRVFVPPWNRCTADTIACLVDLGFAALSRDAGAAPAATPPLVDLPVTFNWFATAKKVPLSRAEIGVQLATTITRDPVVGVMLHHNVTDADELHDLDRLLALLAGHDAVRPTLMHDLLPAH